MPTSTFSQVLSDDNDRAADSTRDDADQVEQSTMEDLRVSALGSARTALRHLRRPLAQREQAAFQLDVVHDGCDPRPVVCRDGVLGRPKADIEPSLVGIYEKREAFRPRSDQHGRARTNELFEARAIIRDQNAPRSRINKPQYEWSLQNASRARSRNLIKIYLSRSLYIFSRRELSPAVVALRGPNSRLTHPVRPAPLSPWRQAARL